MNKCGNVSYNIYWWHTDRDIVTSHILIISIITIVGLCKMCDYSLQVIVPLYKLDSDLQYEGHSWQDQTHCQDDQGQDKMLHSERP